MASDRANLQDAFLNNVRKAKVPVTIFLINGVKLQGVITWFDSFCVLLRRDWAGYTTMKRCFSASRFMPVPAAKSSGVCVQPCSMTTTPLAPSAADAGI